MTDLAEIIRQLAANAEAIRALLQNIPAEQAQWKPDPETWSLQQTMSHFYNEERVDFRKHLKELFSDPPRPWSAWRPEEQVPIASLAQGLESFLLEREASIAWLKGLDSPDWSRSTAAPWGGTISAGEVLASWAAHDYLHIRQFNELLYAWNNQRAQPGSVEYAGEW
jgi:hypothetical protein